MESCGSCVCDRFCVGAGGAEPVVTRDVAGRDERGRADVGNPRRRESHRLRRCAGSGRRDRRAVGACGRAGADVADESAAGPAVQLGASCADFRRRHQFRDHHAHLHVDGSGSRGPRGFPCRGQHGGGFSVIVASSTGGQEAAPTTAKATVGPLLEGAYVWRVQAVDAAGARSGFSVANGGGRCGMGGSCAMSRYWMCGGLPRAPIWCSWKPNRTVSRPFGLFVNSSSLNNPA